MHMLCEACGSEGRLYRQAIVQWGCEPREDDLGPCPECTGGVIDLNHLLDAGPEFPDERERQHATA